MGKKDAENTETMSSQSLLIVEGGFEDQVRNLLLRQTRTNPCSRKKTKSLRA